MLGNISIETRNTASKGFMVTLVILTHFSNRVQTLFISVINAVRSVSVSPGDIAGSVTCPDGVTVAQCYQEPPML